MAKITDLTGFIYPSPAGIATCVGDLCPGITGPSISASPIAATRKPSPPICRSP